MTKYFENEELFDYVVNNGSFGELLTFLGRLHADRVEFQVLAGSNPGDWKVGKSRLDVYRREIQNFHLYAIDDAAAREFENWYWGICRTYGEPDSGVRRYKELLRRGYSLSVGAARRMLLEMVEAEALARQSAGGPDPYGMHGNVYNNYLKTILIDLVNNDPRYLM